MLPRPGIPIDIIVDRLRQLIDTVDQTYEPTTYASWVASAETSLRECFVGVPFERLYSEQRGNARALRRA